jgi:hypothetical protein
MGKDLRRTIAYVLLWSFTIEIEEKPMRYP